LEKILKQKSLLAKDSNLVKNPYY